ncbi:uncharacterized protein LOC144705268 [Wolffia australiana]
MEEDTGLQEWEFLAVGDGEDDLGPVKSQDGGEGSIKHDYFAIEAKILRQNHSDEGNSALIQERKPNRGLHLQEEHGGDLCAPEEPPIATGPCGRGSEILQSSPPEEGHSALIQDLMPSRGLDLKEEHGGDLCALDESPIVNSQLESVLEVPAEEPMTGEGSMSVPFAASRRLPISRGENSWFVWWKLPLELLKFFASRIRPAWSVTIAAALMGAVVLGKKLYRKKPKIRRIPLKIAANNEVAPFTVPVSRLSGVVSAVKRMPDIRASLPTAGATPWPVVALR